MVFKVKPMNSPPYDNEIFSVHETPEMYAINHDDLALGQSNNSNSIYYKLKTGFYRPIFFKQKYIGAKPLCHLYKRHPRINLKKYVQVL